MKYQSKTVKITLKVIEAAWKERQKGVCTTLRDTECRGLTLVVSPTVMVWRFAYHPRGVDPTGKRWPTQTVTLGMPAALSIEEARDKAYQMKNSIKTGTDPIAERRAKAEEERRKAEEERRRQETTLTRLLDDYTKDLPKRPKMRGTGAASNNYVANETAQVRLAIAQLDAVDLPVTDLTDLHIRKLISGDENVRHRYGAMSRFLDWCQDVGHIKTNPCIMIAKMRRPKAGPARSNYLTPDELARLWKAADKLPYVVWRDYVRFLIAVPCRRGEAVAMDWSHIHGEEWHQPSHLTKNRDPHRVFLHPLAMGVLQARKEAGCTKGLVFPSPKTGGTIFTFSDMKKALVEATDPPVRDFVLHDFRRSFATALGEARMSEVVVDAVLNHRQAATRGGVMGVYQRAVRWPEQVQVMTLWGKQLTAAIDGRPAGAEIVQLRA